MAKKQVFRLLMVLILMVTAGLSYYFYERSMQTPDPGGAGPGSAVVYPEPRLVDLISLLSAEKPRLVFSDLVNVSWDYVCFVSPYYDVARDPKLTGVSIPWVDNDSLQTIVLVEEGRHELYKVSRGRVVAFELAGLDEGEACYDSTAVMIEHVEGDRPMKLRVIPRE